MWTVRALASSKNSTWRTILDVGATILMIVAAAVLIWRSQSKPTGGTTGREIPVPTEAVSLQGAALEGPASARVVMLEFSDFQCPFCSRFSTETLPVLRSEFVNTGKMSVAFRHMPLPIHAQAQKAAEAAECAGRQGRFWQMHDALFKQPSNLAPDQLTKTAASLVPSERAFAACLDGMSADKVKTDLEEGKKLRVTGTPAFFIGTLEQDGKVRVLRTINGARPIEQFREAIGEALRVASGDKH